MSITNVFTGPHIAEMTPAEIGRLGEDIACRYLATEGWTIHDRNFRIRRGEIDIIATDGNDLVFIEVKTRRPSRFGPGYLAVDERKIRQIRQVIGDYLVKRSPQHRGVRIDVISVALSAHAEPQLEHLRQVEV